MRWDKNYESSNVEDRRNEAPVRGFGGGGGGIPIGGILSLASRFGWKGILVALVLVGGLYGSQTCSSTTTSSRTTQTVAIGTKAPAGDLSRFVAYVFDDTQAYWGKEMGRGFEVTHIVLFRNSTNSACGTAETAVGPFYCPNDHKVYIDLAFYEELRSRFESPGDFAQAYVIAHEVGHHIQNLHNLLGSSEKDSVIVELQADCLAGAWAQDANRRGIIDPGDIDEALNAASQIGDDSIQKKTQGHVTPETFTHGSAQQRSDSFKKGYTGGPQACGIND